MDEWTEIRRKVLVEGVSKRSIRRDHKIGSEALDKGHCCLECDPHGPAWDSCVDPGWTRLPR